MAAVLPREHRICTAYLLCLQPLPKPQWIQLQWAWRVRTFMCVRAPVCAILVFFFLRVCLQDAVHKRAQYRPIAAVQVGGQGR